VIRPRKSLGQNFLRDDNIARKIAAAIRPDPADLLVEIGPGEGALTRHLAGKVGRFVAVELDGRVVNDLRARFGPLGVEVLHGDVLETDLDALAIRLGGPLRIVGNIPYNITSPILFHVLDQRTQVRDLTIMMQREVARRIVAGPGTKEYGILSVFCRLYADVELLFDVSPNAFVPKPSVVSSVVRFAMLPSLRYELADEAAFRAMVRGVFGKRRKTLRNALRYHLGERPLPENLPVDVGLRPEDLGLEDLVALGNALARVPQGAG